MLSHYDLFIILTDVIAKNCGRSYCQFLGRCYCPYIRGGNVSLILADIGPLLFYDVLADVIAKIYGRSYCQICEGLMLLPLCVGC